MATHNSEQIHVLDIIILKKKRADSTEIPNILNIYNDDRIVF